MILRLMGKDDSSIELVKDRPGHDVRYAIDWTKINTELGWSPSVSLEEGLQKTIAWYTEHRDWWMDVKSGTYAEYYTKQYQER